MIQTSIYLNEYENKKHSFDFKQNVLPAVTSAPPQKQTELIDG